MEINELRVGNLFHPVDKSSPTHMPITTTIRRVLTIGFLKVESCLIHENPASITEWVAIDIHDMAPIVLTEQWLRWLGLTNRIIWQFEIFGDNKRGFHISSEGGEWIFIPYVHTLQNLYFAFTGKELSMKDIQLT